MATTPVYGWRVPVAANAPNVPFDMTNLATDIEASLGAIGTYYYATRGATDPGVGTNPGIIGATLPTAPAGAQWLVNVSFCLSTTVDDWLHYPVGTLTNCTVPTAAAAGQEQPFWHHANKVATDTGTHLVKVTAAGTCVIGWGVRPANGTTNWTVQTNSTILALRVK